MTISVTLQYFTWQMKGQATLKELRHGLLHIEKFNLDFSNPCQSSPSLAIRVPLWFIIISFVFFYLIKLMFSGFPWFKGNFVAGQNVNSKYRDWAPLNLLDENLTCEFKRQNSFTPSKSCMKTEQFHHCLWKQSLFTFEFKNLTRKQKKTSLWFWCGLL